MYQRGISEANVPPLPTCRSANSRPSSSTPQLLPRRQQSTSSTVRPQLPASSSASSSSSSSSSSWSNLDRRVDSSRSRVMNDYRDFPTTTTTTTTTSSVVQPGDNYSVNRSSSDIHQPLPPPRDVELSWRENNDRDDDRGKENKTPTWKACRESIICQRCGRCRCDECARRTATGRRAIEICSCVSCFRHVVAIRRHRQRSDGDDGEDHDDDPCACSPCRSDCRRRWALLVVLSLCLPCLCLYWPLRCVVGTCSRCAGRQVRGCRCVERRTSELLTVESTVERTTST